jgi:hypothetical protein|tara:strand:+ start:1704 stop:2141 length:438 start_codon:yes stop_codon:yes gene_type:complete
MKYTLLILTLFLSTTILAQEKKDSLEIVQLLKEDYRTLQTHDIEKHRDLCTDNYLLSEDGEILRMEDETAFYKEQADKVFERKNYFDFKYIGIFENTAYAVYILKSDFLENGYSDQNNWTESVIFKKIEGVWKIELIHSTPIKLK